MDDVLIYLGTLAAIVIVALILIVIIVSRGSGGSKPSRAARGTRRPLSRVQVALSGEEGELVWAVNGHVTRELNAITDPADLRAVATLIERVRAVRLTAPMQRSEEPAGNTLVAGPAAQQPTPAPTDAGNVTAAGTGVIETAVSPPSAQTLVDELNRPFIGRLRDSIFGAEYDASPSRPVFTAPPAPPPRKGKKKVVVPEPTYGIPRFEELNALVQQKLAGEPEAPPVAIRVGHDGMLEIVVDGRIYGHINDVPDEVVRRAIQSAVEAWNRQS